VEYFAGVDISKSRTAIVIIDKRGNHVGSFFFGIKTDTKLKKISWNNFLFQFYSFSKNILREYPCFITLEDYAYSPRQGGHNWVLREIGGVFKLSTYNLCKGLLLVSPTSLKKFVTGNGRCEKSEIFRVVLREFDFDAKNDDEADAFSLAVLGRAAWMYKYNKILNHGSKKNIFISEFVDAHADFFSNLS